MFESLESELAVLVGEITSADENSLPRFVLVLNIKRHLKLTFTFYIRKSVISLFAQVQGPRERRSRNADLIGHTCILNLGRYIKAVNNLDILSFYSRAGILLYNIVNIKIIISFGKNTFGTNTLTAKSHSPGFETGFISRFSSASMSSIRIFTNVPHS